MSIGLVGRKSGMTRIFTEDGSSIPVTVVEVQPNRVTQIKTIETDGYSAVQVTTGTRTSNKINKAQAGHFAKANTTAGSGLWEFRTNELADVGLGSELKVDHFAAGQKVDVTGTSKGKGFQGELSAITSACRMPLMATQYPTGRLDLLGNVKLPVKYGKVKRWRVKWALLKKPCSHWKLFALILRITFY